MKSFREYIAEKTTGSLFIFDIDETIFHTYSTVLVKDQSGKIVTALDNQQFNDYKLRPGEEFDFSDFKNAQKFFETSRRSRE
jgi:predicted ribosome quality control (RQC) complex YloA/Tae2 family protein